MLLLPGNHAKLYTKNKLLWEGRTLEAGRRALCNMESRGGEKVRQKSTETRGGEKILQKRTETGNSEKKECARGGDKSPNQS